MWVTIFAIRKQSSSSPLSKKTSSLYATQYVIHIKIIKKWALIGSKGLFGAIFLM